MKNNRLESISFAIFLIFVGVLAIFVSLGFFGYDSIVSLLLKFWPFLVIAAGIKILVGAFPYGEWVNLFLDIFFDILIVSVLLFSPNLNLFGEGKFQFFKLDKSIMTEATNLNVDGSKYINVDEKKYTFNIGGSRFTLNDSDINDYLITTGEYNSSWFKPRVNVNQEKQVLNVDFLQDQNRIIRLGLLNEQMSEFDFVIGKKDIKTELNINLGAGEGNIKLDQTNLQSVRAQVGAGKLSMDLQSVPKDIVIKVGAGDVTMSIPRNLKYKIVYSVGAGNIDIIEDNTKIKSMGGLAASGEYSTSDNPDIVINTAVGAGKFSLVLK